MRLHRLPLKWNYISLNDITPLFFFMSSPHRWLSCNYLLNKKTFYYDLSSVSLLLILNYKVRKIGIRWIHSELIRNIQIVTICEHVHHNSLQAEYIEISFLIKCNNTVVRRFRYWIFVFHLHFSRLYLLLNYLLLDVLNHTLKTKNRG